MKWLCLPLAVLATPVAVHSQTSSIPVVHYGKWASAAVAITFTALGARAHANSRRASGDLANLCRSNGSLCALTTDGRYQNADAQQMYLTSRRYDSRARTWLLVGQASLLLSAGLFLADLRHHRVGGSNIPYHPLEVTVDPGADGTRLGLRWTP